MGGMKAKAFLEEATAAACAKSPTMMAGTEWPDKITEKSKGQTTQGTSGI